MASGSTFAVASAIVGNFLVMCSKFFAYMMTSSGAMLSEAIHSAADVLNQSLILLGIWLAARKPDVEHPYGYFGDRFVWAMISAVGIFFLGCGVTAYHGVHSLIAPPPMQVSIWAYIVLGFSLALEGVVFTIALRSFLRAAAGRRPLLRYLWREADPAQVAVLLEDGVAVTGIVLALVAIGLSNLTGNTIFDSFGTLFIAALLGFVAVLLVAQNRRLLIGTAAPQRIREKVIKVVSDAPTVEAIYDFKSRILSVDRYRVKMEVEFDGRVIARRLEQLMREAYPEIDSYEAFESFCEDFADKVIEALGDEVDAIEERIQEKVPSVQHVDIEAD